jgi:hypothetical protein
MLTVDITVLLFTSTQLPPNESIVAHGIEWYQKTVLEPLGGVVPRRTWSVRSVTSYLTLEGGDVIHGDNPGTTYVCIS